MPLEAESDMARGVDEDQEAWKAVPATYADTFEVSVVPDAGIVRIAFGEYAGRNRPHFIRSAIAMPMEDAKALGRMLRRLIRETEEEKEQERITSDG
jgi:hypothetical protein